MDNYVITIEETVSCEFHVCASRTEEPIRIAIEKYKCGEFVLAPGFVMARRISANAGADE